MSTLTPANANANTIAALRQHLLDTLADLRNPNKPLDIERAQAVAGVAKVLIDSARVEVDFIKATGCSGSGFIPEGEPSGAAIDPEETLRHERTPRASNVPGSPFAILDRKK